MHSLLEEKTCDMKEKAFNQRQSELLCLLNLTSLKGKSQGSIFRDELLELESVKDWLNKDDNTQSLSQFLQDLFVKGIQGKQTLSYYSYIPLIEAIQALPAKERTVDLKDPQFMIYAIEKENFDLFNYLVTLGSDPNGYDSKDVSSEGVYSHLHRAYDHLHRTKKNNKTYIVIVSVLLVHGANSNQKNIQGLSLVDRLNADKNSSFDSVFLSRYKNISDFIGPKNVTALDTYCRYLLLDWLSDNKNWDFTYEGPSAKDFLYAVLCYSLEKTRHNILIDFLLELHKTAPFIDTTNTELLPLAINRKFHKNIIKKLIECGFKLGEQQLQASNETSDDTILTELTEFVGPHKLSILRSDKKVEALIQQGLISNEKDVTRLLYDLLSYAIEQKNDVVIRILLELNNNDQFLDRKDHLELLAKAVRTGESWIVFQVLSLGIEINFPSNPSVLYLAFEAPVSSIIEMLVDAGADMYQDELKSLAADKIDLLKSIKDSAEQREYQQYQTQMKKLDESSQFVKRLTEKPHEFLSKLASESTYAHNLILFWLIGRNNSPFESILEALSQHAKQMGDLSKYLDIQILLKIPTGIDPEKSRELFEAKLKSIAEKLGLQLPYIHEFPDGMLLIFQMAIGLLKTDYTEKHLLNDLFMLSIKESNQVIYQALLELNSRESYLDLTNPKIVATARETQNSFRVRELIEYGFAEQSIDEGKKESAVEDLDSREEQSEYHVNDKVNDLAAQINQKLNQKNAQKQLAHQWKAYPRCPTVDKKSVASFLSYMSSPKDFNNRLSLAELPAELNYAIENLVIYGAKLWKDSVMPKYAEGKEHQELWAKIASLSEVLRHVLSKETLAEDVYTAFQEKDVNRGTNVFKVHSFFAGIGIQDKKLVLGKTYTDKDGAKHLIKSTSGELVYEVYRALQKQAVRVDDDLDENRDHESQQSVSQG